MKLCRPHGRGLKAGVARRPRRWRARSPGRCPARHLPMAFPHRCDGSGSASNLLRQRTAEHYDVEFATTRTAPRTTLDRGGTRHPTRFAHRRLRLVSWATGRRSARQGWVRVFYQGRPVAELSLGTTRVSRVPTTYTCSPTVPCPAALVATPHRRASRSPAGPGSHAGAGYGSPELR